MLDETFFNNYLEALLRGDRAQCRERVQQLVQAGMDIKEIYTHLFQRSLYRVGELWETNRISVASEHLATAITEGLLSMVYPQIFAAEHIDKKAVISCTVNEWHQIGGKMVADIFELNGWHGHFLGANTPVDDLLAFIHDTRPDVLGLSLSLSANLDALVQVTDTVRSTFGDLDIFFGGQAFRWVGLDTLKRFPRTSYVASLADLEKIIKG